MKCPLKFYLSEEEVLRKQLHSINLSPNDIYIIDDEDVCVMKVVKPEGKAKCKHGSKVTQHHYLNMCQKPLLVVLHIPGQFVQ